MEKQIRRGLFSLLVLMTFNAEAQIASVGWDDDCDYDVRLDANAINTALADSNAEIRVTDQNDYLNAVRITDSVILEGGYADCAAANLGSSPSGSTRIDGTSILPTAIKIYSDGATVTVSVSGFTIESATAPDGAGPDFNAAAGLVIIHTGGIVDLHNLLVNDNHSEFWSGGIAIRNDLSAPAIQELEVNISNTLITNNSGGAAGGGFACLGGSSTVTVNYSGASGISFNHSDSNGGGVFVDDCILHMNFGTASPDEANPRGIHGNTSDRSGGGMAVFNQGFITMTGAGQYPFNVTSNQANLDLSGSGDGGGIYLSGAGVDVVADRLRLTDNSTDDDGGGAAVGAGADLMIHTDERGCDWNALCGEVAMNRAANGGGFFVEGESFVSIIGMEAFGNRAGGGVFMSLRDDGTQSRIETALLHHNGHADHIEFTDNYLIWNSLGGAEFSIYFSTIVDNDVQDATLSAYNGTSGWLTLQYSIIDDPGITPSSFILPGSNGTVYCNIVSDQFGLAGASPTLLFEEIPQFADRPAGDYHLSMPPNTALDQCQVSQGVAVSVDADGEMRGNDLAQVVNGEGPFDIGYDEYYTPPTAPFFSSGFE